MAPVLRPSDEGNDGRCLPCAEDLHWLGEQEEWLMINGN